MSKKMIPPKEGHEPPSQKEEARVDEQIMEAGEYEVTPEHTFDIDLFLKRKGNRWIVMNGPARDVTHEQVVMRMWQYDEMVALKKKATTYDQLRRIHMVDHDALNQLKIQKLLVSWTFDKENPRLRIQHSNGVLTDESWKAFTRLQANLSNHIIDRMNDVLEYNG